MNSPSSTQPSPSGQLAAHNRPVADQATENLDALNEAGNRIQQLVGQIDALPDSPGHALFQECLESVLKFYGYGLERILQIVATAGPEGKKIYGDLIRDGAVRGLLLIHDLHPVDIETRLREALDKVRPYLESHGGNVELIDLTNDVARLRLQGTCKSCASSTVTLELAIRHAIEDACPDLVGFEVEGLAATSAPADAAPQAKRPDWITIENAQQLENDTGMSVRVGGLRLIICRVNGNFYAYRNNCPTCNAPLSPGTLEGALVRCGLGHRYDIRQAGRCRDNPSVHLDPFPLLVQDGSVKVAMARGTDSPPSELRTPNAKP
jgi:Fe-S cluster biogenesis protein NfuA/nitrite reductase/ring-hydroxylating ferredoxin subunit